MDYRLSGLVYVNRNFLVRPYWVYGSIRLGLAVPAKEDVEPGSGPEIRWLAWLRPRHNQLMGQTAIAFLVIAVAAAGAAGADEFATQAGPLTITPIAHASLMIQAGGQVVHVDPARAEYGNAPKADLILITHGHGDHFDPKLITLLSKSGTVVVAPPAVAAQVSGAKALANGESTSVGPWKLDATPAYNIKRERAPGQVFHPKGEGNGYVVAFGGFRICLAGDTENIPELASLQDIGVAFLPMNLPYTMPPEEAAEAAKTLRPKIVYPYHYRGTDLTVFEKALAGTGIEVRLREWYP